MTTITATNSAVVTGSRVEEILAVSTKAFALKGFRATDVQEIADTLGIGKGTIYRTFPTKQALFLACADRAMMRLQETTHAASAHLTDGIERIRAVIKAYLKFFDDNSELLELIIQERSEFKDRDKPTYLEHKERCMQPWLDLFSGLIEQGIVRPISPEKITSFISHQLYGKLFTHYFTGERAPLSTDADQVVDMLLHGFMVERKSLQS